MTKFNLSSLTAPKPIKKHSRKNLSLILELLAAVINELDLKPDDIVTSEQLEKVIRDSKLAHKWDLTSGSGGSGLDKRALGLRRAIGDLLGGHGLHLQKCKGGYAIPSKLPVVEDDCLIKGAVYK